MSCSHNSLCWKSIKQVSQSDAGGMMHPLNRFSHLYDTNNENKSFVSMDISLMDNFSAELISLFNYHV